MVHFIEYEMLTNSSLCAGLTEILNLMVTAEWNDCIESWEAVLAWPGV